MERERESERHIQSNYKHYIFGEYISPNTIIKSRWNPKIMFNPQESKKRKRVRKRERIENRKQIMKWHT